MGEFSIGKWVVRNSLQFEMLSFVERKIYLGSYGRYDYAQTASRMMPYSQNSADKIFVVASD